MTTRFWKAVGLGSALAFATPDGPVWGEENVVSEKSKVIFSGRLHAQFHTSNVKAVPSNSSFFVRRARLTAEYENMPGTLAAEVQYDLGEGDADLKSGLVDLRLSPRFNIMLGQYKKPFSLWEQTSSRKIAVIERANSIMGSKGKSSNHLLEDDGLYAGRDIGAMLHGEADKVEYYLGVFNGNGSNTEGDDDDGKLVVGRIVINSLKDLAFGASVARRAVSSYADPVRQVTASANFEAFEFDFEYGIRHDVSRTGVWIQTEFAYGSNPYFSDSAKFLGFAFIGSYNVRLSKGRKAYSVRPAFRFDYAKGNTDDDDTGNILFTSGLDIFLDKHNKVQMNLDINLPQKTGADPEMALRVQFQMHI